VEPDASESLEDRRDLGRQPCPTVCAVMPGVLPREDGPVRGDGPRRRGKTAKEDGSRPLEALEARGLYSVRSPRPNRLRTNAIEDDNQYVWGLHPGYALSWADSLIQTEATT
jgi:hypothetical protein